MAEQLVVSYLVNLAYLLMRACSFGLVTWVAWRVIDRLSPIDLRGQLEEGSLGAWIAFAALLLSLALLLRV